MNNTSISKVTLRMLALALALITMFSFVACGGDPTGTEETTQGEENTTEESGIPSNLPETLKFNNQEVRIYIASDDTSKNEMGDVEDAIGIINQAIVERNYNAEDRLGIILSFIDQGVVAGRDQSEKNRNIILSGGGASGMDLITGYAYYSAALAAEGLLYNLMADEDNNYVEFASPWYNQTFVEECSYNNSLFWSVGDLTVTAYDRTVVTFFNEDALQTWSIEEDLYQIALDGKWTIEKMRTLIKDVHEELDNTEGKTKGDFHGLVINCGAMCADALIVASGINVTTKNGDGVPELSWTAGTAQDAYSKLFDLFYNTSGVFLGKDTENAYHGTDTQHFSEQVFYEHRSIFSFGILSAAQVFATDTTLHYGILPLPKYNENQRYQTTPHDAYTIVGIPGNIGDRLAIATATLECLYETSYYAVRPVYFEMAYKLRYASGENTARLFDTVIDSISFCFGGLYSYALGDPTHQLRNRLSGTAGYVTSNNLSAIKGVLSQAMKTKLALMIEDFDNMKNIE